MRTVHETEALRPSDPVPKHHSSNPQNKSQRLRLTFNKWSAGSNSGKDDDATVASTGSKPRKESPSSPTVLSAADLEYEQGHATFTRDPVTGNWIPHFPPDISFTDKELELPPAHLYQLLKHQLQWAMEESEELDQQVQAAERIRKAEWIAKELVLNDVIDEGKAVVPDEDPDMMNQANEEKPTQSVERPDSDEPAETQEQNQNGDSAAPQAYDSPNKPGWGAQSEASVAQEA